MLAPIKVDYGSDVKVIVRDELRGKKEELQFIHVKRVSEEDLTTTVRFLTDSLDELLVIEGGFCIGYDGTGPVALYGVMMELGIPEVQARKVFERGRLELFVGK